MTTALAVVAAAVLAALFVWRARKALRTIDNAVPAVRDDLARQGIRYRGGLAVWEPMTDETNARIRANVLDHAAKNPKGKP